MALTRAFLKGMGLTEEQVSAIIDEHTSVTQGLIADRDRYKADAEKLPGVQQELEALKNKQGDDWEAKFNTEHQAFETYKQDVAKKELTAKISSAYKTLLADNKVGEKYIDSIIGVTDFSGMKLDKDGKLTDTDKLVADIKSKWSGFITSTEARGSGPENPPGSGSQMTKEAFEKLSLSERMQYANSHPGEVAGFYK